MGGSIGIPKIHLKVFWTLGLRLKGILYDYSFVKLLNFSFLYLQF